MNSLFCRTNIARALVIASVSFSTLAQAAPNFEFWVTNDDGPPSYMLNGKFVDHAPIYARDAVPENLKSDVAPLAVCGETMMIPMDTYEWLVAWSKAGYKNVFLRDSEGNEICQYE